MPSRQPKWCVAEISKDGKINAISPAFEYLVEAEKNKGKLLATGKYQDKNVEVIRAPHPVDPRKPPHWRRR